MWIIITILFCIVFAVTWLVAGYSFIVGADLTVFEYIAVSLFLMSVPIFEPFYVWFTYSVLGIIDARHTIYIGLIGFLLIYVFYLTTKVSRMDDRMQQMISFMAVFEKSVNDKKDPDGE